MTKHFQVKLHSESPNDFATRIVIPITEDARIEIHFQADRITNANLTDVWVVAWFKPIYFNMLETPDIFKDIKRMTSLFSAVGESMKMFIKAKNPEEIRFTPSSRKLDNLYSKMMGKLLKIIPYRMAHFGDTYILKRK